MDYTDIRTTLSFLGNLSVFISYYLICHKKYKPGFIISIISQFIFITFGFFTNDLSFVFFNILFLILSVKGLFGVKQTGQVYEN